MSWNMRILETHSSTTTSESHMASTPTSSSTRSDIKLAEMHNHLKQHVEMMMDSLAACEIVSTPSTPIYTAIPFDRVFVNIDRCQQNLNWYLPNDIWTDDIEEWLSDQPWAYPVQVHPAPNMPVNEASRWSGSTTSATSSQEWRRTFPSFPLPPLDLFTDIPRQKDIYSPSIYSQDDHPLGDAAHALMQEVAEAPINYRSIHDIIAISKNMRLLCEELRATTNRAEDTAEFDSESDSNSDVSWFDLEYSPAPAPAPNFYQIARSSGLIISASSQISSDGSLSSPPRSSVSVRNHYISSDICGRIALVAAS